MPGLVLIDRDGTINVERHYLSDPDQIELFPNTVPGLKLLNELGFSLAVVTNQSAVGRGYFDIAQLDKIHHRLNRLLTDEGVSVDAVYYCPHIPEDGCRCRKPETGMALDASKDLGIGLTNSFVIGDNVCDINLGKNIGAVSILVKTGYGNRVLDEKTAEPDYIVEDLLEAAELIKRLSREN